ncbi:MAG: hypothetical protein AB7N76_00895 [Planctomycetota bacterium]
MNRSSTLPCLLLALLLPSLATAGGPPPLVAQAPRWKVGDWWVVAVFAKEPPAPGGAPAGARPLTGLTPLVDGVPRGWVEAARWRFCVRRRAPLPDAPAGAAPCFVVQARQVGASAEVELWYSETDLRLARLVLRPGRPGARTVVLRGRVQLDPPAAALLGLPLAWPDLRAGRALREVRSASRAVYEQRATPSQKGEGEGGDALELTLERDEVPLYRFRFEQGLPWWRALRGPGTWARLLQHGHGCSESSR